MTTQRVTVDRALYASALSDAIAWQSSILETHDPTSSTVVSCCRPAARCEQYQKEAHLLTRYTAAQAALRRQALLQVRREVLKRQATRKGDEAT